MYPHFIEIHAKEDGADLLINIDNIVLLNSRHVYTSSDRGDECVPVAETYTEMKDLIIQCGCHIEKTDPRLDISQPLTIKDLKHMIGEPVWNSNSRCWMLVSEDRGMAVYLIYNAGNGVDFSEGDLIKFPLYRMRRN